jgi:hypothetical protein
MCVELISEPGTAGFSKERALRQTCHYYSTGTVAWREGREGERETERERGGVYVWREGEGRRREG